MPVKVRIKSLNPIDTKPSKSETVRTRRISDNKVDPYNIPDVRSLNAMMGTPDLPKPEKKKVVGLNPNKGTPDEKKLNRTRGKEKSR